MTAVDDVLLAEAAERFAADRFSIDDLRAVRDGRLTAEDRRRPWREMGELGWAGITIGEEHGGMGAGLVELAVVAEALGRRLAVTPLLSTVMTAAVLELVGTAAQRHDLLPRLAAGELTLAWAHWETARFSPGRIRTTARSADGGWVLDGGKSCVFDACDADSLLVVARADGSDGLSVFLINPKADGVTLRPGVLMDGRPVAAVRLDGVNVDDTAVVGEIGQAAGIIGAAFDRGLVAESAEMLGAATEAFRITTDFLRSRHQFGVPIGAFQALQHRAAHLLYELELSRSIVEAAARAVDENRPDAAQLASASKARLSDTFLRVAEEGVQMHGGIGVTDEAAIGHYLKRARVSELLLGDSAYHRDRFARLAGY